MGGKRRRDKDGDPKGLHTVVIPAIESLRGAGLDVVGSFADRNVKWRPHESMPHYYSELDVLICASRHEGTPNPVLEAMACGVPVLSTDVGIVDEAFGPEQAQFVLRERTTDALVKLIRQLYEDRSRLRTLSQENLKSVRAWTWQHQAPKWRELFEKARSNQSANRDWKKQALVRQAETAWKERHSWLSLYRFRRR
jgi:glycosyltransferase involved in cell wall biosynthesis